MIDLDVQRFFDSVPGPDREGCCGAHRRAVGAAVCRAVAFLRRCGRPQGVLVARERGTPQVSAVSPVLANLFMHYAFDTWLAREYPGVWFERYADDAVRALRDRAPGP